MIGSVKPGKPKCRTIVLTKRIDLNFSFGAFSQNNASLRCFRFKSFCTSRFIFCQHGFADIHSYLCVRACGPHEKEGGEGHPRALGKGLRAGSPRPCTLCTPSYEWMSEVCSYPISRSYLLFLEKKLIQISFLFHI